MASKYSAVDEAIILKISVKGARTFSDICTGELLAMADAVATPRRYGPEGWRVIDRRLQALRKAGKLTFSRKEGWMAA